MGRRKARHDHAPLVAPGIAFGGEHAGWQTHLAAGVTGSGRAPEAVRALAHNGLLDIRQGSGTYVVATSELAGVMRRRFVEAPQNDVVEVRRALEASAAGLAAVRRTEEDLRHLDALLETREKAWADGARDAFVTADAAFHLAVVAAAHNEVLGGLYADLAEVIRASLRAHFPDCALRPEQYVDHARLVEAIRGGDAAAASTEAAAYIRLPVRE